MRIVSEKLVQFIGEGAINIFLAASLSFVFLVFGIILLSVLYIDYNEGTVSQLPETGVEAQNRNIRIEETVSVNQERTLELRGEEAHFVSTYPEFVFIEGGRLVIEPHDLDVGEYFFTVKSIDEGQVYSYRYLLKIVMRSVNFTALEHNVRQIIGPEEIKNYAVYVYDLKREEGFDINGDQVMRPGSTSKLPYGIIILRDVDAGKYTLDYIRPSFEKMLKWSDNDAMMYIDSLIGGFEVHNERVKNELGIDNFFRLPHTCTARSIGETYYGIYHQKFLSKELNDYLIDTLINVAPGFDNRLKQGIPDTIDVAHKTGYVWTDYGVAYNDTALVYGEETDFILVVLDKDTTPEAAMAKMKPIAEIVYTTLDSGSDPKVLGISTMYDYQQM